MNYSLFFAFLLLFFNTLSSFSNTLDSIKVIVMDEKERSVADVKVFIEGYPLFVTNKTGTFKFMPIKKISMPLNLRINKEGLELDELNYYENEKEIEIILKKSLLTGNDFMVVLTSPLGKSLNGIHAIYANKNYVSDREGKIKLPGKNFLQENLIVKGFRIDKVDFSESNSLYTLQLSSSLSENISNGEVSDKPIVAEIEMPAKVEAQDKVFKQYEGQFEVLSKEIVEERARLIEGNKYLNSEIEKLTLQLKTEKNLTPEQKEKLKANVDKLERELIENTIAYNKSEEKSRGLIANLKMLLMQKDSLNYLTLQKLKVEEKKRELAEKKAKRTLLVFTIITIAMLFLAIVFYSIAKKLKNQRTALMKINEELEKYKAGVGEDS